MAEAQSTGAGNGAHKTLAEALLAAQTEMPSVDRDQENPHFKSKFVSLGNLLTTVRPVLNKHGLALLQAPEVAEEGRFVLRTTIIHSQSGEKLTFAAPLNPTKNDPQGQGSAITYMRRYSLAAALAIADQDDDGNGATAPEQPAATESAEVGPGIAVQMVDRAWEIPTAKQSLQLAASSAAGRDVGDCSTKKAAKEALAGLTFPQAEKLDRWIEKKKTDAEVDGEGQP